MHPEDRTFVPKVLFDKHPSLPEATCSMHHKGCYSPWCVGPRILSLDKASGHIGGAFVHYLMTDEYPDPLNQARNMDPEFECIQTMHMYCAAANYGLGDLASKVEPRLRLVIEKVPVYRLLEMVGRIFPWISEQTWFEDYITFRLRKSFEGDERIFDDARFLDNRHENVGFVAFLARVMRQVYKDKLITGTACSGGP
ncbi:hypothetical protein BDW74DRAFT_172633 [Aspergillus multicolor]|uniref:uncharacterized protein n=1 Tax=Aspergillus multicolor TaxID=41759 RepID=UPI003CCC9DCF